MPTLNDAAAVYVGATPAQAVYLGDTKVWPSGPSPIAWIGSWPENTAQSVYTFVVTTGGTPSDLQVFTFGGEDTSATSRGVINAAVDGIPVAVYARQSAKGSSAVLVGSGITAGMHTVTVTMSGPGMARAVLGLYQLTGFAPVPDVGYTVAQNQVQAVTATVPVGGVVIAATAAPTPTGQQPTSSLGAFDVWETFGGTASAAGFVHGAPPPGALTVTIDYGQPPATPADTPVMQVATFSPAP